MKYHLKVDSGKGDELNMRGHAGGELKVSSKYVYARPEAAESTIISPPACFLFQSQQFSMSSSTVDFIC